MILYCWTIVPADLSQVPTALGITDDEDRAREVAERSLHADRAASHATIVQVRPALVMSRMDCSYVRTGQSWTARRTRAGRIRWTPKRKALHGEA